MNADVVWFGRVWYETALLAFLVAFFAIEMVLLWRKTRLGWAMTAKCAALILVFGFALANPPPYAPVTLTTVGVALRVLLVLALSWVIYELAAIRLSRREIVIRLGNGVGDGPCDEPDDCRR